MISAVIFDLDGTVLDNEGEWETAFQAIFDRYHLSFDHLVKQPNGWMHEPGIGILPNWKRYFPFDLERIDKLSRETWNAYEPNHKMREGLVELVEKSKEKGWQTGLCTGSSWNVVERELEELNLYLAFDVTTTGEEVMMQKPDPEIYLLTAQKLGLEPAECLVIEDAVAGVRAGVEAGCKVIALESDYAPAKLLNDAGAGWVVKEMVDILNIL